MRKAKIFASVIILTLISVTFFGITAYADNIVVNFPEDMVYDLDLDVVEEQINEVIEEFADAAVIDVNNNDLTDNNVAMAVIFVFLLAFFILLIRSSNKNKSIDKKAETVETEVSPDLVQPSVIEEPTANEEELIAVITAAIVAATQKPASGFKVTSFKKRGDW